MQSLHHKLGEGVAGKGQEEDKDDTGRDWSSTDGFLPLSEGFHFQTFQKQNKTKKQTKKPPKKQTNKKKTPIPHQTKRALEKPGALSAPSEEQ